MLDITGDNSNSVSRRIKSKYPPRKQRPSTSRYRVQGRLVPLETSFFLIRLLQQFAGFSLAPDAQPEGTRPPESWAEVCWVEGEYEGVAGVAFDDIRSCE